MKPNRIIGVAALAGLALAITGCVVTSIYPYYFEKDLVFEPALLGEWRNADKPDEHWKFEAAGANGYRITSESGGQTTVLQGHVFKLNGQAFLDVITGGWKEDIQPEPVPSHLVAKVVQFTPTVKLAGINYDWLKELLTNDPTALRHLVIQNGEKPEDRRFVLTADTAALQQFVLKHLQTEGAWEKTTELQPISSASPSRGTP